MLQVQSLIESYLAILFPSVSESAVYAIAVICCHSVAALIRISSEMSSTVTQFSAVISELISKLKTEASNPVSDDILVVRIRLRNKLRSLLLENVQAAATSNVDRVLWTHCFYEPIQYFRREVRNSSTGGKGTKLQPHNPNSTISDVVCKQQQQLKALYRNFLSASSGFLSNLFDSMVIRYNVDLAALDSVPKQEHSFSWLFTPEVSEVDRNFASAACHKYLLYLGDIARYRHFLDGHTTSGNNLGLAQFYYNRAMMLDRTSGDAFAQLALIASIGDHFFVAAHNYSRAALAVKPSTAATGNMHRLYCRIAESFCDHSSVASQDLLLQITWINCQLCIEVYNATPVLDVKILEANSDTIFGQLAEALSDPTNPEHGAIFDTSNSLIDCVYLLLYTLHETSSTRNESMRHVHVSAVVILLHYLKCLLESMLALSLKHVAVDVRIMQPVKLLCSWLETSTWCWCKNPDTTREAPAQIRNHPVWIMLSKVLNSFLLHLDDGGIALGNNLSAQDIMFTTVKPDLDFRVDTGDISQTVSPCSQYYLLPEDRLVRGFAPLNIQKSSRSSDVATEADLRSHQLNRKIDLNTEDRVRRAYILRFGVWLATHLGGDHGTEHLIYLQRTHAAQRPLLEWTAPVSSTVSPPSPGAVPDNNSVVNFQDSLWAGASLATRGDNDDSTTVDDISFGSLDFTSLHAPIFAHVPSSPVHGVPGLVAAPGVSNAVDTCSWRSNANDITPAPLMTTSASTAWDVFDAQSTSTEVPFGWGANSNPHTATGATSWTAFPSMSPQAIAPSATFASPHRIGGVFAQTNAIVNPSDDVRIETPPRVLMTLGNQELQSHATAEPLLDTDFAVPQIRSPDTGATLSHKITAATVSMDHTWPAVVPRTAEHEFRLESDHGSHEARQDHDRDPSLLTPDQVLPRS